MRGFTLMELIVVLLLLSLIAGLTMPRLLTMYTSVEMNYIRKDIAMQLNALSYHAFRHAQPLKLSHYPLSHAELTDPESDLIELPLALPDNWFITTETPVTYQSNGACAGGTVYLHHQPDEQSPHSFTLLLQPPFCEVLL